MTHPVSRLHQTSARAFLFAALLLSAPSCVHKKAVIFDHDPLTGQETMTYRGKQISPEELYDLAEKAGENQIDMIIQKDGQTQKLDLKTWHTGMKFLPAVMQSMQEDTQD